MRASDLRPQAPGLRPQASGLIALAALVVVASSACRPEVARHAAGQTTRIAAVHRGKITDRVLLAGELRATSSVDLVVPRTDQWMLSIRWMVDDGTPVKAGDRVFELDNSQFTQQLEEKRLALQNAEMTLAGARALSALDIATKELELRQHQLELQKTTVNADVSPDLLSGREAQDRQLKKKEAQIAADKAAQDLAAQKAEAALDLRVKQIDADKARATIETAEHTIAGLVVVAPSDGVTVVNDHPWTGRKLHITDQVPAGTPVVSLPDLAHGMRVRADLSDVDDGRVQVGAVGTCTLDAYPGEPIACTVDQLTPVARPKTGQGSLRRAFTVELALATSDAARMRPGMSVEVELHAAELDAALVVPRAAVMRDQTTARVQLSTGELREVALGPCDAQACAVTRGLVDGERVVIGGGP